jgi:hypothetical protein
MKSTLVRYMRGNLPAYVNGTLGSAQLWILERWLARDSALQAEVDELRGFRSIMQDQALINPDPSVLVRVKSATAGERIQPRVNWQPSLVWPMIIALLAVAAVLFWRALPPGLEISWSLDGPVPESFKVYRAPVDSSSGDGFSLIGELPAQPGVDNYGYTDLRLVPGQQFLYQVEAVDGSGNTVTSKALTGNSLEALPRQVFFLTIFVVICFALLSMLRQYRLGKSIPVHFAL